MHARRSRILFALVAVACTACLGAPSGSDGASRPVATSAGSLPPTTADPGCRYLIASTARHRTLTPPAVENLGLLTDATATPDVCYDKVTFTFKPTKAAIPPGYDAAYLDEGPPTEPNAQGVQVNSPHVPGGTAWLVVTFTPALSRDMSRSGHPLTYLGNLNLGLQDMRHVLLVHKHLNDGESSVTWLIELDVKRPFIVDSYVGGSPPMTKVNVLILN